MKKQTKVRISGKAIIISIKVFYFLFFIAGCVMLANGVERLNALGCGENYVSDNKQTNPCDEPFMLKLFGAIFVAVVLFNMLVYLGIMGYNKLKNKK